MEIYDYITNTYCTTLRTCVPDGIVISKPEKNGGHYYYHDKFDAYRVINHVLQQKDPIRTLSDFGRYHTYNDWLLETISV